MIKLYNVTIKQSLGKPSLSYTIAGKDIHGSITKACKFANKHLGVDMYSYRDVVKVEYVGDVAGEMVIN
jgi:hypothetical protein